MAGIIKNGRTHNPLTLWILPVLIHVCTGLDAHTRVTLRVFSSGTLQQQQQFTYLCHLETIIDVQEVTFNFYQFKKKKSLSGVTVVVCLFVCLLRFFVFNAPSRLVRVVALKYYCQNKTRHHTHKVLSMFLSLCAFFSLLFLFLSTIITVSSPL